MRHLDLMLLITAAPLLFWLFAHLDRAGTTTLADRFRTLFETMRLDNGDLNIPSSAELRDRCQERAAQILDLQATPEARRAPTYAADLRTAVNELQDANVLYDTAARIEADSLQRSAWDAAVAAAERAAANPSSRGGRGPNAAHDDPNQDTRTAGEQFTAADGYTPGNYRSAEVEVRNLLTGSSAGGTGSDLFVPVGSPFMAAQSVQRMNFFLRDFIPVTPTQLENIPYIQELNAVTNETGANVVKEASAKPEVTMQFQRQDAPVRKIAAWIQLTEEAYNDAPTLRGYIDVRLAYMLQVREEQQYLNGNGTSPQILGILNTTGIQTQTAVTNDLAGTVGLAVGKIENVDGMADAFAINPITYWTGTVTRHSSWMDGAQFGSSGGSVPFGTPPSGLWGLPAIRTRAMSANKALVGNYRLGAQIFERQGTTIKSTDSHASLFISNTLVVLAEKREALAVHRPDFFVDTTLSFS